MLTNYFKIAFRSLWKNRLTTVINLVGLSVAFGASALLFMAAYFEWSFDRFHLDAGRMYRLFLLTNRPEKVDKSGVMPYPLTPALKQEFPEVEQVARLEWEMSTVQYGEKKLSKDVYGTDADFLRLFSFPMRQGDPKTALADLSSIVLSEETAKAIFGKANPMGKSLRVDGLGNGRAFIVTGVIADAPNNSSVEYDALVRIENGKEYATDKNRWGSRNHQVFLKLRDGVQPAAVEQRLKALTAKYFAEQIDELRKMGARPDERGELMSVRLQPFTAIHFDTESVGGMGINQMYVYALTLIGVFILVIASINFINLSLARTFTRAREVGVRKSLGALRGQLFGQFWAESGITGLTSLVLGLALAYNLRPTFNRLFGAQLTLDYLTKPATLLAVVGGFGLITALTGGYPAWLMTRFNTVDVLKGQVSPVTGKAVGVRSGALRSSLIVVQFALACLLITCTIVVLQQLHYLREKPLGFTEDQVISLPVDKVSGANALRQLRNRLANNPDVVSVSGSGVNIGHGLDGRSSRRMSGFLYKNREVKTDWIRVDYDYLKTLGIKLLAGRDFSPQRGTDTTQSVIVSSSMAKQMGEKNPVGVFFRTDTSGPAYQIVGIIPDYHLYDLRNKAEPITLHILSDDTIDYLLIRVTPTSMTKVMVTLKELWREIAPKSEFQASFVNENTNRWYKKEERLSTIFSMAAGITILLSCMGLFAIALMTIEQRTKEIGVRKVLGASVSSIVSLLSRDFLKLVVISIVIASPIAGYAMNQWLADFAYRVDIEWWVFLLAGLGALLIAFLTVSYQSIRAALMNPVKSLRTD